MSTLHEDLRTFMLISRWILLTRRTVWDKSCTENQNVSCVQHIFFIFFENGAVYEIMWENCRTVTQATNDNMVYLHSILDAWSCKHTFKMCNSYWFSSEPMATWMRLKVTLDVYCLSCFLLLRTSASVVAVYCHVRFNINVL